MRAMYLSLPILLLACAPDDPRPVAQRSTSAVGGGRALQGCDDPDGDGFGPGCSPGEDCDDDDPRVTDACYRCALPAEGCECAGDARPAACVVDTNGSVTPDTCYVGQRTCVAGRWSVCAAYGPRFS
jgi:hypothetical protein